MEAVVEFEYTAEQNDELTLKVGDKITGVKEVEGGWCEGELNGRRGVFPENFVKLIKPQETMAKLAEPKREAPQRKSVRALASKLKDNLSVGPQKKKEKQKRCKALFEYIKENNDELTLAVGDIVEFIREVEDGWWEGSLNGKQGVFPSNFVEMLEDTSQDEGNSSSVDEKDRSTADAPSKDADFNSIKGKKVVGVGLGNIFDKGPIKLSTAGDSSKQEDSSKPVRQESTEPSSDDTIMRNKSNSNLSASTEQAVVRFSYTAEQPDELSLVEGQIVRIIEKKLEDEGWWKGEVNGKVGIFPDNFVQLLPPDEKNKPLKPPTPVAPPTVKAALPKLPDKVLIKDTMPNDKIKSEPQQPFAPKKPQMPPPMIKKPFNQKSVETKPEPSSLNHQANAVKDKIVMKENSVENHNSEGPANFDDLEPSSQRLTHLTHGRAQGPKKRPPSSALVLTEEQKDKSPEEVKTSIVPGVEKQQTRLLERPDKPLPVLPPKDYKHPTLQADPAPIPTQPLSTVPSLRSRDPPTSTPLARPPEPTKGLPFNAANAASTHTMKLIEQLTQQLNELKANSVNKTVFSDLQVQHEKLKIEFENMKKNHALKICDLTNEVDVEKKLRLTTQAEIELVKKSLSGLI